MTYTVIAHVKRKVGTTPFEFRKHYDTVHVPLLKSLVGATFPLTHTRNYVTRNPTTSSESSGSGKEAEAEFLPVMYKGDAAGVEYDSLTVMVWEDKGAFDLFKDLFYTREVFEKISEDEKNFLDQSFRRLYALEQPVTTERN
ncbi:hypothetical protein GGS26DRAFT_560581 [Hypomontagnella submonticulosa]|nr:hypothetical protein GGS26DRAFT_560581 [Hypomontagnella submonticulosa]